MSPHLLLQYLIQGFETCYIVQNSLGDRILIPISIAELYFLKLRTCSPLVDFDITSQLYRV